MTDGTDRLADLWVGEAHSDNAEYYIERRDDGEDVHYRCFGSCVFARFEGDSGPCLGDTTAAYHLWQRERDGARIEEATKDETVWSEVDARRESRSVGTGNYHPGGANE